MRFAEVLRELRKGKGYTQLDLAKDMSISKSSISMYENGNREPDFETLEYFADYFNVDMDFLLGKSRIMRRNDLYRSYADGMKDTMMVKESESQYIIEEDWTEEELIKIEEYKQLLKAARNNKK